MPGTAGTTTREARAPIAATAVMLLALGVVLARTLATWNAFDTARIGRDGVCEANERFASLRAHLPANVALRYVSAPLQPGADEDAVISGLAAALQRCLAGDMDAAWPAHVVDLLLDMRLSVLGWHPERSLHDLPALRADVQRHLIEVPIERQERLLRYVLAPHFVSRVAAGEWAIGDFPAEFDYAAFADSRGLVVVASGGPGAVLLRAGR